MRRPDRPACCQKLAIEQGLLEAYRKVFGTLFWFLVLPGPTGAVLYSLTTLLAQQWRGEAVTPMGTQLALFGHPIQRLQYWLDWVPVRLTAHRSRPEILNPSEFTPVMSQMATGVLTLNVGLPDV